jgi:hypothetical protein
MNFVEHKQKVSEFFVIYLFSMWAPLVVLHIKIIISLIPNNGQHLHINQFTTISNANFEFMEILRHGEGGVDTLLNISPPPHKKKDI